MNERSPIPWQNRRNFLREVIAENAHLINPSNVKSAIWTREKNIVGVLTGSPATGQDLAKQYELSRERIRQLHKRGMRHLHENASDEIKTKYPLNVLLADLGKKDSGSLLVHRRRSMNNKGVAHKVAEAIEDEAANIGQIMDKTGFGRNSVHNALSAIRSWGVDVSGISQDEFFRFRKVVLQLEKAKTSQEEQGVLNSLQDNSIRGFYMRYKNIITTIGSIMRANNLSVSQYGGFKGIVFSIKDEGIPFRETILKKANGGENRYYLVLVKYQERILELLERVKIEKKVA